MSLRIRHVLPLAAILLLPACGPAGKASGPMILPQLSPVNLGKLYQLPSGKSPDYMTNEYVPYSWALQLQSTGSDTVVISKACLVGNTGQAWVLEGPDITKVIKDGSAVLRITYQDQNIATKPDNVAIVVQSNAKNFPTLVVPVCAETVAPGDSRKPDFDCTSPASVTKGQSDPSLCK